MTLFIPYRAGISAGAGETSPQESYVRLVQSAMGNFDFESGKRFIEEGDLAEGIRCFLASLDQDPSAVETYIELLKAYEHAWHESADPMVLDQMRKVAVDGLKRDPTDEQRRLLVEGRDRADEQNLAVQRAEEDLERQEASRARRLPVITDTPPGGEGGSGS